MSAQGSKKRTSLILLVLLLSGAVAASVRDPTLWWVTAFFACAVVWRLFPRLQARSTQLAQEIYRKRQDRKYQTDLQRRVGADSEVSVSEHGIKFGKTEQTFVSWGDIVRIELVWDENPWGDPLFGRYNDVSWRVQTHNRGTFDVEDSDVHRFLLEPAFVKHLIGYTYEHDAYAKVFANGPGNETCWARTV